MNAKKIAASIPGEQFRSLERVRRARHLKRSEAIQEALDAWLAAQEKDARSAAYLRAYLTFPEDGREGTAYAAAWSTGQPHEDWEE